MQIFHLADEKTYITTNLEFVGHYILLNAASYANITICLDTTQKKHRSAMTRWKYPRPHLLPKIQKFNNNSSGQYRTVGGIYGLLNRKTILSLSPTQSALNSQLFPFSSHRPSTIFISISNSSFLTFLEPFFNTQHQQIQIYLFSYTSIHQNP